MNILHVTPYYAPAYAFGGVVRSVEGMARALARRGHVVAVLTTDAFDQTTRCNRPDAEIRDGVRVVRARNLSPWLRGRLNLSTPLGLPAAARALVAAADVIHCHEFRTVENLMITPFAKRAEVPLVLSPHGTLAHATGRGALKQLWDRMLSPVLAQRFDAVIGLTSQEVEQAQTLWRALGADLPAGCFDVIPNGVDLAEYAHLPDGAAFREKYHLGNGPVCLFMSRLHPRKGPHLLAEAFQQLNLPAARLVIAGPEEGAGLLIAPFADSRIVQTGYLEGAERLAALAAADVLALPAVGEGLPMILLEAMAAGLPVIISPGCYLPEAAQNGAGLEVEPHPTALAEALKALLESQPLRLQMGTAARQLVRARFTWDAIAEQLESLYIRLAGAKKGRPAIL